MQRKQKVYSSADSSYLRLSHSLQLQTKKQSSKHINSPYKQKCFSKNKIIQSQISTNPTKPRLKRMSQGNFRLKMYSSSQSKPPPQSRVQDKIDQIDADEINRQFVKRQVFIFQNQQLELGYHNRNGFKRSKYSKQKY